MGAISSKLRKWVNEATGEEGLSFWCQACEGVHGIRIKGEHSWTWNGDADKPVFGPSVGSRGTKHMTDDEYARVRAGEKITPVEVYCHTFVGCNGAQPGEVIFLADSTHALAGTVQPFPDLPDWLRND